MFEEIWKSIAAMDEVELERAWKSAGEGAFKGSEFGNKRMFLLLSFFFHTSPTKVLDYFGGNYIEQSFKIAEFLNETIWDVKRWLVRDTMANEEAKKLRRHVEDRNNSGQHRWIDSLYAITPDIEAGYISNSANDAERKIRAKVLAALDVVRVVERLEQQNEEHPSLYIVSYFLLLRSLVQFASYSTAIDGTERQLKRKMAQPADYGGYLAFLKRYFPDCASEKSMPQNLWNQIINIFHTDGLVITCNHYKISLIKVHIPTAKNQEGLRQISPSGAKETLGFKAFSDLHRKLKKGSLKLS